MPTSSDLKQIQSYSDLKSFLGFFYKNGDLNLTQQFFQILFEKEIKNKGKAPRSSLSLTVEDPDIQSYMAS
jgi:hypothetical protein